MKALAEAAFPKRCACCGRSFDSADQFLTETKGLRDGRTGLKQAIDDAEATIVEVYRNCPCGSTLMDFFTDRRDCSEAGCHRRTLFDKLIPHLESKNMTRADARQYLLRTLRGET
ncbi:MAG: oxidoreductase [Pseudomonadota bacterium]